MSCSSCGGSSSINTNSCAQTNSCSCSSGGCVQSSVQTGTPVPFYNNGKCMQEAHCSSVIQQIFVTALSVQSQFVWPACSVETVLSFLGLAVIQIGSYLWNAQYGYLVVTDFDPLTGDVTAMNECTAGNVAPGTVIPRCTLFNVVDAP